MTETKREKEIRLNRRAKEIFNATEGLEQQLVEVAYQQDFTEEERTLERYKIMRRGCYMQIECLDALISFIEEKLDE